MVSARGCAYRQASLFRAPTLGLALAPGGVSGALCCCISLVVVVVVLLSSALCLGKHAQRNARKTCRYGFRRKGAIQAVDRDWSPAPRANRLADPGNCRR